MPSPTSGTTVQRPDLRDALWEYVTDQQPYIGLQVYPIFETQQRSGGYPVIPTEALLKLHEDIKRAAGGTYPRGAWQFGRGTYACEEYGFEEPVDDSEARAYAHYFDAEAVAGELALDQVLRQQEKRILDRLQDNAVYTTGAGVTNEWDDAANAVPITDVQTAKLAIFNATGLMPNTLVVAFSTFQDLNLCAQIADRIKYVFPGMARPYSADLIAQVLGVEKLLVSKGVYDSTDEGQSTTIASLWSNEYAWLGKTASGGRLKQPCAGRTFLWTEDSPDNAMVESYREDSIRGDVIRVRQHTDEVEIMVSCAYLFENITTI